MTTPEGVLKREQVMLKVFWIILVLAVFFIVGINVLPSLDIGTDSDQTIGITVLSGFFAMIGLIGVSVLAGRQKKLKQILNGQDFITKWDDPELGVILLSRTGFFCFGEFFTSKGYSCSIKEAKINGNQLIITYLMAKKGGHGKYEAQIDIPQGQIDPVKTFCNAVSK